MKKSLLLSAVLILSIGGYAQDTTAENQATEVSEDSAASNEPQGVESPKACTNPHGWSFDFGGQYTWMAFSTPPVFTGNTGGVVGKITYQEPNAFFGQLRSIYGFGSLSSDQTQSDDNEWYTEFVGGYCFCVASDWTLTPYAGVGLDFLNDDKEGYATIAPIDLYYRSYYALFGFDMNYVWENWYLGWQAECLPVFHQYLSIGGLAGAAWKMHQRIGVATRLPIGIKLSQGIWLELAPYYRLLPIGSSKELGLPERTLNQAGAFLTFRFFL